jgi:membrane protein implicated in regulation of membrane protease activity
MDIRPGLIGLLLAVVAAVPTAVFLLTGEWLALGTFLCIAVIGVFLWYLFDGNEPDHHASEH